MKVVDVNYTSLSRLRIVKGEDSYRGPLGSLDDSCFDRVSNRRGRKVHLGPLSKKLGRTYVRVKGTGGGGGCVVQEERTD